MKITNILWTESGLNHNCTITLENGVSFHAARIGTSGGCVISSIMGEHIKTSEIPAFYGDLKRFDAYLAKVVQNTKFEIEARLNKQYA